MRRKILALVGGVVVLSLAASMASLFRVTETDNLLERINSDSIPTWRSLIQLQSDAEVLRREAERSHARVKPIPKWILDIVESEAAQVRDRIASRQAGVSWQLWASEVENELTELRTQSQEIQTAISQRDHALALRLFPSVTTMTEQFRSRVAWAVGEYESVLKQTLALTESRISQLRTGLELMLVAVIVLSLLMLWLSERALRPIVALAGLAREISKRGLKKEDKTALPGISLSRNDEVSRLTREFHAMATAVLERERMIETQKNRLEEQNRLLRDMAELRERLRSAENLAAVGRMSAQVAHEVRNPLHSIGLEAEMALDVAARLGNAGLKQALQSILTAVDRLEKITENYLKLSKLSSGKRSMVDPGELVESVLATYAPACEAGGVKVDWRREERSRLCVVGDRDMLEQVFGNLMRNALQALEYAQGVRAESLQAEGLKQKCILWRLGNTESRKVFVSIEDTGPGVDEAIRKKLFTPFVTTKAQGTGLGLSFVKTVVEDHGGSVSYVERHGKNGACFQVLLPSLALSEGRDSGCPESTVIDTVIRR